MTVQPTLGLGPMGLLPLRPDAQEKVQRVVVDCHLHKPDMFEITFLDDSGSVVAGAGIEIGTEIWVKGGAESATTTTALIAGEVTSIEGIYEHSTIHTIVRGYEKAHRMQRMRKTRTWVGLSDDLIAMKIATEYKLLPTGIKPAVPPVPHEHLAQVNQTDWEFLAWRAAETGREFGVSKGAMYFRAPPGLGPDGLVAEVAALVLAPTLTFRENLLSFRPRIASAGQMAKVEVRVWDPKGADVLVGTAPVRSSTKKDAMPPGLPSPYSGADDLAEAFPPPGMPKPPSIPGLSLGAFPSDDALVIADRPVAGLAMIVPPSLAVDATAAGAAEHLGSTWAEAEGVALGDPAVTAGASVKVTGVAAEFLGTWHVTGSRHVFDAEENGYTTRFTVSGSHDRSLLGLTSRGSTGGTGTGGPHFSGLVCGIVSNVLDLEGLSRVKVALPWLSPSYESDWARVVQLGAGKNQGATFLPEVGDEVLVGFEMGDPRRPYVLGGLVNKKTQTDFGPVKGPPFPPGGQVSPFGLGGKVVKRGVVTRTGRLLFDDDPLPTGLGAALTLGMNDGKQQLKIDQAKGSIELTCEPAPPTSASPAGTVKIKVNQAGTIDIEAGAAGTVNIRAGAGGSVTIDGGLALTLKGQTVKIQGTGPVEVTGTPIKLN